MDVRGERCSSDSGLNVAAIRRDLPALKCMLAGMNQEQKFNILKITDSDGWTSLHHVVKEQRDHPYSSEVAKELTNNVSTEQLYQLLKMKTNGYEDTVLHIAVFRNRIDFVTHILAQVTFSRNDKLLSIRNTYGATPADLSVTTIFSTVQGLREAQQKIETVNGELVKQGGVQNQLSDRCKQIAAQQAKELKETKKALVDLQTTSDVEKENLQKTILQMQQHVLKQTEELDGTKQEVKRVNGELVKQEGVQNQLSDRCQELEAQQAQELKETKKALVDLLTTSDEEKEKLQKGILQMEQNVLKQTEVIAEQTRELNVQKNQLVEQDKAIEQTNKVLTDLQQSSKDQIKALENQNILQTEVIFGQKKEISQHGQTQQILLDKCAELERQKQEQGEVIQVMTARQALMEQMLERLELEFRRPIVTDETGDQENEDY